MICGVRAPDRRICPAAAVAYLRCGPWRGTARTSRPRPTLGSGGLQMAARYSSLSGMFPPNADPMGLHHTAGHKQPVVSGCSDLVLHIILTGQLETIGRRLRQGAHDAWSESGVECIHDPCFLQQGTGISVTVPLGSVLAGKYRVDRVLGQGGMGIVVQAMHLQLHQPVAMKFLLPEVLGNQQVVQRFLREAQVGSASRPTPRCTGVGSATPAGSAQSCTSVAPTASP
jgi:hypothetical protein